MRSTIPVLLLASCVGSSELENPLVTRTGEADDAGLPDAATIDASVHDASEAVDAGLPRLDAGELDAGLLFDAGTPFDTGTGPDSGTPASDAGLINVLIAQGRLGRIALSCDDGLTWVDRDEAAGQRCGDPPLVECFHHAWASMGLVSTGTSVLATFGWGPPGAVRRTTDGVTWQSVTSNTSFSAIAFGDGAVMGAASPPRFSSDDGDTWRTGGSLNRGAPTRYAAFLPGGGGRFFISTDTALLSSDDRGVTSQPVTVPSVCLGPLRGILTQQSTVVLVRWDGGVCTSTDRGQTWTNQRVDQQGFSTSGVVANGAFFLWNGVTRYRSTDGLTWTSARGTPIDVSIGAVAVTPSGTFVAFKGGWQSEYQHERVYRSVDGLTWQAIPAGNHAHSHPITHLIAAPLHASTACP